MNRSIYNVFIGQEVKAAVRLSNALLLLVRLQVACSSHFSHHVPLLGCSRSMAVDSQLGTCGRLKKI